MATAEFNQSINRLAQYRPFADEGRDMTAALEDLVVGAAAIQGGGFTSLGACQDGIRELWGLELEMDEVRECLTRLSEDGRCERKGGGFNLTESELRTREEAAAHSAAIEETAFRDWHTTVLMLEPTLSDDQFASLRNDLRTWLGVVVARHGVEAALILYPEEPRAQKLFSELEQLGLGFLPRRTGSADVLRDRAFQLFVRQPTEAQRQYLANLLNTSFYLTVLTLDPEGSRLIQQQVKGHRLYLDTNFLYSVLGLSKATEALAAARLLDLSRSLGYQLAVTPWTIRELRTSLDSARNRITGRPLPRRELADLMVKAAGDVNNFVTAFWKAYRDRGTQPKDFFEYFDHVESLLRSHEIEEVDQGCVAVEQDRDAIDKELVVLERYLGERTREERVMEHDVKHRLLVERLRGKGRVRFSNARFWFLTQDSKLPRYASATIDGEPVDLPFCVSTSAWVQVVRAFTPRTADYDQTVVDLLSTPYVRYRGAINPQVVQEIVGRIDQFEGADAALASEVLADTALVRDIAQAQDDVERAAKIENAFVVKAQELRERLEETERRVMEIGETAAKAKELAELEAALRREAESQTEQGRSAWALTEAELRAELEAERERADEARRAATALELQEYGEASRLQGELDTLRGRVRAAVCVLVGLGGIALAVAPIASGAIHSVGWQVVAVCSGTILLFLSGGIWLGWKRAGTAVTLLLAFAGFVGTVLTIIESLRPH